MRRRSLAPALSAILMARPHSTRPDIPRRAAGETDEVMMKDWRRMLTEVGGYDNALIGVPAGAVREMIDEIDALRAAVERAVAERDALKAQIAALFGAAAEFSVGTVGSVAWEHTGAALAQPAAQAVLLDCRTCAYFTKTCGCMSSVQCVNGDRFVATRPHQYWEAAPEVK
jgi:hypothetical protein